MAPEDGKQDTRTEDERRLEAEAAELAKKPNLTIADLLQLVRGLRLGKNGDFFVSRERGIEATAPVTEGDPVAPDVQAALIRYEESINLPPICTPKQLLDWFNRNQTYLVGIDLDHAKDVQVPEEVASGRATLDEVIAWADRSGATVEVSGFELRRTFRDAVTRMGQQDADTRDSQRSKPVTSTMIKNRFRDIKGVPPGSVDQWWNTRMGDAKRYGLVDARASRGRGGRRSLWHPDSIASWLVDKRHMTSTQAGRILREHFPDCADSADLLDQSLID